MNENIDQFGRSNKNQRGDDIIDNTKLDHSKKIKQSLAEIKEQLIQENFNIERNEEAQTDKQKNIPRNDSNDKTIKELENKIKSLEFEFKNSLNDKLNSIEDKISNLNQSKVFEKQDYQIDKIENNTFFELDNQLKPLTNNAVLVINKSQTKTKVSPINKIFYLILTFISIYLLSVFISLSMNRDIDSLKIFGKDYLMKFLEIINYI